MSFGNSSFLIRNSRFLKGHPKRQVEGQDVPQGALDITFYRDDLMAIGPRPVVGESELPQEGIDGKAVVIVDDVSESSTVHPAGVFEAICPSKSEDDADKKKKGNDCRILLLFALENHVT